MPFSSYLFLFAFLPLVVLCFWVLPQGFVRLAFLTIASCVFYGFWDWRYIPLLLGATFVGWLAGHDIAAAEGGRRRKVVLVLALTLNVGILAYFKYRGFFLDSLSGLFGLFGEPAPLPVVRVLLPLGISFYTFAAISYVIDVYRGTIQPARSIVYYWAYATMFPYVTAGPIIRYGHVGRQLERPQQRFHWALVGSGLFFLILGLAKKLLFADMIAPFVNPLYLPGAQLTLITGWAAALGYTLQLYFDFSGYSDMAVGAAFLLGVRFPQNFNSPYKAVNVSDFWRRWHMTLSSWLRDYLFIPLGGSREGQLRTIRNLLIVFLLGGLWHGPSWTFVIWGLLWGVYLSIHSVLRNRGLTPSWTWLNRLITFVCAVVAWVFFRATSVDSALNVLKAMAGFSGVAGEGTGVARVFGTGAGQLAPVFAGLIVGGLLWVNLLPNTWQIRPAPKLRWVVVLGLLLAASLLAMSRPSAFLYLQF